jgi:hypothetical protein
VGADLTDVQDPSWLVRTIENDRERQRGTRKATAEEAGALAATHKEASTSGAAAGSHVVGDLANGSCLRLSGEGRTPACVLGLTSTTGVVSILIVGLLTVSICVALIGLARDEFWQPVWEPGGQRQLHQVSGPCT